MQGLHAMSASIYDLMVDKEMDLRCITETWLAKIAMLLSLKPIYPGLGPISTKAGDGS